ncbi:MAG: SUMF1/EgtB/PvdO family nonheme iron enzyme [Candidatus Aminicenantes bacterium]|nr:SUMF1/EgtB/PvdO family nonheme iron enzyme [Candidatus Aminicenantes bacterium]NIQ73474.1 SUMF1/EgtB/PvdO family nonheme iron enzyme [Candidatus Aminicenantes bacterium]NIT29543.1 SUMF1/EgtB/PvdO family nonheme iron enzyme [Candidatus Aminicenantes bacterium]
MVFVKGGTFTQGSREIFSDEEPIHKVSLDSFYLGRYEVTQAEWQAVMGYNPSMVKGDALPVESVDWYNAIKFCNKKSRAHGLTPCYSGSGEHIVCNFDADGYRLPTEAEWEYASRVGLRSRNYKYSGGSDPGKIAWYEMNSGFKTRPVGQKEPNELGIYDMNGNVGEWCWDRYDKEYYKTSPSKNPVGPSTGGSRSYRGGCFGSPVMELRPSVRFNRPPGYKNFDLGFRLAKKNTGVNQPPEGMVPVRGGTFKMGSSTGRNGGKIVHRVTLDSFYIGRFEVTQGEWEAVMGNRPSERIGTRAPINFIDWYEAVEYCNRRSRLEGLIPFYSGSGEHIVCNFDADGYRLPTEAEWEFASRGGIKSRNFKYSGSNHADEVALYRDNLLVYFEPVGQRKPNELGIYDMSGNMAEWCWDWYDFDYYRVSPAKNPRGPLSGVRRVIRGGGWAFSEEYLCTGSRFYEVPFRKTSRISFRVVRSKK